MLTDGGRTIVYNNVKNETTGNIEYVRLDTSSPTTWLSDLYDRGATSLMIEGGASVLNSMLACGIWDEARIETASALLLVNGVKAPQMPNGTVTNIEKHATNYILTLVNNVKSK